MTDLSARLFSGDAATWRGAVRRARSRAAAGAVLGGVFRDDQYNAQHKDFVMGMLDGLLAQVTENVDIKNLAAKVGLTPEQVESAVQALGVAHPQPGDTVATAAESTGLPTDVLQQIVGHIGGEGALGNFASLLGQQDGMLGKLGGLAAGFFEKK